MTSRLRAPGGGIKPPGSKLARPVSGLRPPSGSGSRKTSPQLNDSTSPARGVSSGKKPVVQVNQVRQIQQDPRPPVGTANGQESLEVGDRVLANGKPGLLAFLGNTQFAKGSWAGIILDSYEGKNNGSVNGIQYFESEPNRGLFAKAEKIKLVSKGSKNQTSDQSKPSSVASTNKQNAATASQFGVGDRVLVDGQKEGVIGFIGETQFAKGIWTGVILDVPEGKNDGTVSGVRYFECEPNCGLFTRPHKLKIISKACLTSSSPHQESVQTPVQDSSPVLQRNSQPTPVDLKALHEQLQIGDLVLVGGVKEGVLRFLGPTEFAKGIWVGVELPEPLGKNDGSVSGKRYFQCEPKYGLFAPLPKVEKLASAGSEGVLSNNPSLASLSSSPHHSPHFSPKISAVQNSRLFNKGGVHTESPLKARHPSESSISSFGSSRLMQDASLQGTTAADLSFLLQEKDAEIHSLQSTLDQRELEKQAHQEELTELRRQVDDLQFQLEEQGVISGDQLETATETSAQSLTKLTEELQEERRIMQQLRNQLKSNEGGSSDTQRELIDVQSKLEERSQEVATHLTTIAKLTEELHQKEIGGKSCNDEKDTSLLQELTQAKENLESERNHLSSIEKELAQTKSSLEAEKDRCTSLEQELTHTKEVLSQGTHRCTSLERELNQTEKTAQELQDEVKSSQQDLREAMDMCSQHEALMEERTRELNTMEDKLRQLSKEKELWFGERSRLRTDQERLTNERDRALAELDHIMTQSASVSTEQNELSQQRRELLLERDSLLAQQQAMHTEHEKLMSDHGEVIHQLNELQQQKGDILDASQQMSMKYSSVQGELMQAKTEIEKLKNELLTSGEAWDHEKFALQEQIELSRATAVEVDQRVSNAAMERDSALQEAQELAERLENVERERDGLQMDLETAQIQAEELQFQLDELSNRHLSLEHDSSSEVLAVQQRLEATELILAEREREVANAQEKITSLSDDLIASQGKHDQALLEEEKQLLEEEKQLLEERVKELTLQLERSQERRDSKPNLSKAANMDTDSLSLRLEETQTQLLEAETYQEELLLKIEDYKQQTDFLNSVISDLQNKLEGVEAMKGLHGNLESVSDYVIDDDDEYLVQDLPPPRLFCDICDVFDQHDTDDCPMQTMSDSPPHSMHHGSKAPGGSDRPYCENCEMFGHWTDSCEYETTY